MSIPPAPQAAVKYEVEVLEQGRVELNLPYAVDARVTIIVIPEAPEHFLDRRQLPPVALHSGTTRLMMRIGMQPKYGDIVLIPIPFTDLSSQKQRPVIVISKDVYNRASPDMIVVAMTSNPNLSLQRTTTLSYKEKHCGRKCKTRRKNRSRRAVITPRGVDRCG